MEIKNLALAIFFAESLFDVKFITFGSKLQYFV